MNIFSVTNKISNPVAFKGHRLYADDAGFKKHKFFLPYDETKYTATIELRQFKEVNGKWLPLEDGRIRSYPLPVEGKEIRDPRLFNRAENIITGYRYVLSPKDNPSEKIYHVDSGVVTNVLDSSKSAEHFTLLFPDRTILSDNGLTKQVMPDICFPGYYMDNDGKLRFDNWVRERALNSVRNHANRLGGNFAGIIRMLPVWRDEGYTKIVGTPFAKDELSSHLYWTENPMQLSSNLGNLRDFKNFQIELFKNGINFIADGAFVNQGLQGVLFRNVLRHGEKSPFFYWFKAAGFSNGGFKLGVIPANEEGMNNFAFRFVNAPVVVKEDNNGNLTFPSNNDFDMKKPTYIQLYDKRLAGSSDLNDNQTLIKEYAHTNTENPYEITNHEDVTQPVAFEISPAVIANNIKSAKRDFSKSEMKFSSNAFVESFLAFPTFRLTTKDKGGIGLWDGNMDVTKLNFYIGNTDQEIINADYIIESPIENFTNRVKTTISKYNSLYNPIIDSSLNSNLQPKIRELGKAAAQVRDYTVQAGKYWTKLVADTQLEYIAETLGGMEPENITAEGYQKKIKEEIQKGNLPAKLETLMTKEVLNNALNDEYKLLREESQKCHRFIGGYDKIAPPEPVFWNSPVEFNLGNKHTRFESIPFILSHVMDFPFDSIEFNSDLTGVLASPFISKRGIYTGEEETSRFDLFYSSYPGDNIDEIKHRSLTYDEYPAVYKKTDKLICDELLPYVLDVISDIDEKLPNTHKLIFEDLIDKTPENIIGPKNILDDYDSTDLRTRFYLTSYGRMILPLLIPEIVRYALVTSLNPDAKIATDASTGKIDYDTKDLGDISLISLNISGSPEDEAKQVLKKISDGLKKRLTKEGELKRELLASALITKCKKIAPHQLKVAKVILDKSESGLGWRIDAAKDIGNIDALRTLNDNDESMLSEITDFWGTFNRVIKTQNPHAYTTAEITDFDKIVTSNGDVFNNDVQAETKFIERSGLNNTANYMFFYSLLRELFSRSSENGGAADFNQPRKLYDKLITGWANKCHGFLFQYPGDSVENSYTFMGNHDKPRVLHTFAIDMELFHSNVEVLSPEKNSAKVNAAAKRVLLLNSERELNKIKSVKALAMGDRLISAFVETGIIAEDDKNAPIRIAIAELAKGKYKGKEFDADAFGTRDFRHAIKDVLDVAEYNSGKIEKRDEYFDKVLENILVPAMDKMETAYKMLVTLPGSPTDFVGDKEGSTGYETKSNNDFQQNRNVVPFEWVNATLKDANIEKYEKGNKQFVNDYYNRMTEIGKLRSKKELSALRNGETVALPMQKAESKDKYGNVVSKNVEVAATFRYDDKGSQVICLYTTDGATLDVNKKMHRNTVNLDVIKLSPESSNWKEGLKAGLKVGDRFRKVNDPTAMYEVFLENNNYVLRRVGNDIYKSISIMPEDMNTAIFYKENPDSAQGNNAATISYKGNSEKLINAKYYYAGMK